MQEIRNAVVARLKDLLSNGTVTKALGYGKGEFFYDNTPTVFNDADSAESFVYDSFCGGNLSKYLVANNVVEGKTAVVLKPCDTYSMNQLMSETRVKRDNVYIIGVDCSGMVDIEKVKAKGIKGINSISEKDGILTIDTIYGTETVAKSEVLLEKCESCRGKKHMVYDELIAEVDGELTVDNNRFDMVDKLDKMTSKERFEFWQNELSKCIRCNACRNACPACSCRKCVFDNAKSGVATKANSDEFEEKLFHIIRAFHVAGRCTDCGECSRVCPQSIPLHLLNRKFIKEINGLYGEYQAGADAEPGSPLTSFTKEDSDPSVVSDR